MLMGGRRMSGHERRLGDWTIEDIFDLLKTQSVHQNPIATRAAPVTNDISQQMRKSRAR
jgi:hypothetical protein